MQTYLQQFWQTSWSASRAYVITQIVTTLITLTHGFTNMAILEFDSMGDGRQVMMVRIVVESFLFLLITHFFIRSYLKLTVVQKPLSIKRYSGLGLYLLLVSVFSVFLSYQIGDLPYFETAQPESFTFSIDGRDIELNVKDPTLWLFATLNQLILYVGWTLFYVFWHSLKSRKELQKQMQEARIQQLTNQLSPHFLFNTLNSIRALIFEDKEKAADLVTQLSEIFRTHLQAHLQPSASLEQEWQVAERYLIVEQARFEERLQISYDFDEALWQQKLPTLCLLTLIENAIKHGISPNPEQGYVQLEAKREGQDRWRLIIKNSTCDSGPTEGTKTGLKNTRDRLELMFGKAFKFRVINKNNEFTVIMEMPYDQNADS